MNDLNDKVIDGFGDNFKHIHSYGSAPLVVLFGPIASGKTMSLIRLSCYLMKKGYTVRPIESFKDPTDQYYKKVCDEFYERCFGDFASSATAVSDMLLVGVLDKHGKMVCQLLDAPGSLFFDNNEFEDDFPTYLHSIIGIPNKRVWCFYVEQGWDYETRKKYLVRVDRLVRMTSPKDKFIFVFNKVDETDFEKKVGMVSKTTLLNEIQNGDPFVLNNFRKSSLISWLRLYKCQFVPFSSGVFSKTDLEKKVHYFTGPEKYPQGFWKALRKCI